MVPLAAMRTHGVTWASAIVLACASVTRRTPSLLSARQNVMPPSPASTLRRERFRSIVFMSDLPRRAFDGGDDARIGAAAADVAVHVLDDLRAARLRGAAQELGRLHDLARLAV